MPKLDFAERYRAIPFEVSCTSRTMHAHDFAGNFKILARFAIISRNLISNRVYRIIEILMCDANVRLYSNNRISYQRACKNTRVECKNFQTAEQTVAVTDGELKEDGSRKK